MNSSNLRAFRGVTPRLAAHAWVDPSALLIGDVELGEGASVWPLVVARADIHRIRIGTGSNIQDGSVLHVTHASDYNPGGYPLEIGAEVTVGHRVVLHGCCIGDRCLIGMGSILLDGAVLEPEVLLGAGSLVAPGKRLKGGHLWVGQPARCVRPLSADELAYLGYAASNYRKLAGEHAQAWRDAEAATIA